MPIRPELQAATFAAGGGGGGGTAADAPATTTIAAANATEAARTPHREARSPTGRATAIAFAHAGLAKMGLPQVSLDSFADPYREGMMQEEIGQEG